MTLPYDPSLNSFYLYEVKDFLIKKPYMPFITFIYKIGRNSKTYYGKICTDYVSDDHEGLDNEVKYLLIRGINAYRKNKNMPQNVNEKNILIGVLSFSSNQYIPTYSTDEEIKCFDFYSDYTNNIYVNGKKI